MPDTLANLSFTDLLGAVAAKSPAPGGGAVASCVGALSAALAEMVVNYSVGKKSLATHDPALRQALTLLARARSVMLELATEDANAYSLVNELSRFVETDPRRRGLPGAQLASVQAPLAVMAACTDLLRHFEQLASITNRQLRSDLAIAAILADGAASSSRWNVRVNAGFLPDPGSGATFLKEADALAAEAGARRRVIETLCEG